MSNADHYIECVLWREPERIKLGHGDILVHEQDLIDDSDHARWIARCSECGLKYLVEWVELTNWDGGNDSVYVSYFPYATEADLARILGDGSHLSVIQSTPSLNWFKVDGKPETLGWKVA